MTLNVALCDLQTQYSSIRDEVEAAIQSVLDAGRYILGPRVVELEEKIAAYCGCRYAAGVANGTDALYLALRALNVGPGDEVITTPFTFIASSEAICAAGATPVFVDIDAATLNMDPQRIEDAITTRTKAIMPVHLYGQPCEMDAIGQIARDHNLRVVEDCAQAFGATYDGHKVGTFGAVGCFSFFPSKNLGCYGDGGMVVTDDRDVYEQVRQLRCHGGKVKYHHTQVGVNSRLDELQAAILLVKLKHIDRWNAARRDRAYRYNRQLNLDTAIALPRERTKNGPLAPTRPLAAAETRIDAVYHQFTICLENRDDAARELADKGVATAVYYPVPLHRQAVHQELGYQAGSLPCAEHAAERCLSLPMYPELSDEQQDHVVTAVTTVANQSGRMAA